MQRRSTNPLGTTLATTLTGALCLGLLSSTSASAGVLEEIRTTGKFEDDTKNKVVDALKTFAKQFA